MKRFAATLSILLAGALPTTALADPPAHVESPPTGIAPSVFATDYSGCLGGLRSFLAKTAGFHADFNPGKHQGTVAEEEFLKGFVPGVETDADLATFCALFE